jgi:subtilisin family serine protease
MTSGTSFAAAYVSGLAALVLERDPALKPNDIRGILTTSARDLGIPGRDDLFGAGEADAYAAVRAVTGGAVAAAPASPAAPVIAVSDPARTVVSSEAPATTGRAAPAGDQPQTGDVSAK